jgi:hypothetical protein
MNARVKKIILLLLAVALIFSAGQIQNSLNGDRARLGLTHAEVLQDAPPMLAFTTVALGGFRGLISNFLWMRANDLQQDDKFFEAAQLADWITDLEPHFPQVWVFEAWNMSYNISVKFKDFADRWRWVENGIELLRDRGLKYNPNEILIYRELAWNFQHKMGANLDDANMFYKQEWAKEMTPFFGANGTNYENLISPQNANDRTNAFLLREKYKLDPAFIKKVDDEYGPLDWRLPEAHAIYWAVKGLDEAKKNPGKVNPDDLITLQRVIYQSLLQTFHHGRILIDPFTGIYSLGPNLDIFPRLNAADEELMQENPKMRDNIASAHRNHLRDAVYFLYEDNQIAKAQKWFKYLGDTYPNKPILENDPTSLPKNLTLDEYAVAVVQIDIGETSQERVTAAIGGMLARSYYELAVGNEDRFQGYQNLAAKVYQRYRAKTAGSNGDKRIPLPPFDQLKRAVLQKILNPQTGVPYAARAVLRSQLSLPGETNAPPISTNTIISPRAPSITNSDSTNSFGK